MPVIQMYGPKMTNEQKKQLIAAFATETGKVLGLSPEAVNTTIFECDLHNVGNGTKTLAETLGEEK